MSNQNQNQGQGDRDRDERKSASGNFKNDPERAREGRKGGEHSHGGGRRGE